MSSEDQGDGDGADPHRGKARRAQQQPQTGSPSDGTQWPAGEPEQPPGDEQGAHGVPSGGSGTTRPVGGPATSERPGAGASTPSPAPGPEHGTGTGTPAYGGGESAGGGSSPGAAPGPGVTPPTGPGATSSSGPGATPPTGPDATSPSGPGATPPTGPGATSSSGPGATPPPGPGATSSSGSGATPPPGSGGPPPPGAGSPYDQPPGAMPPPPPTYGVDDTGGAGYGGAAHGAPDPRLAGMPPLGGLGRRLLARIIDGLVVYIPVSLFLTLIGSIDDFGDSDATGSQYGWGLLGILVYLVYEGLMLTRSGQTVGKKLMGIRVGMLENGAVPAGNPGWIRAAVYSLPGLVPCVGTLFWLYNVLSCTWDKPFRQCVHDKVAKTVVVSTEGQRFTP